MRVHESGYELDVTRDRLDLDLIERWLAVESYWAAGRARTVIERSLANSAVYGLYAPQGAQVGLFRVVTDQATFAWLCDVFVDSGHRGRGLAQWAVGLIRDDILGWGINRIILSTADAHGVYAKAGFEPLAEPERMMAFIRPRTAP